MALRANWASILHRGCPVCNVLALLNDGATQSDAVVVAYAKGLYDGTGDMGTSGPGGPPICRHHERAYENAISHLTSR